MKRLYSIILIISTILSFAGCNNKAQSPPQTTAPATEQTQPATEEATEPVFEVRQLPMASVCVSPVTESFTAQDGTVIFNHSYQNMHLIVQDPEVAEKVILDFLNRTDIQETVESMKEDAMEAYKAGSHLPYFANISYDPARIDNGVLSMIGSYVDYSGGAHASYVSLSVTYDLVAGDVLGFNDILTENSQHDTICQLVLVELKKQQEESELYQGYEGIVTDLFNGEVENWYLSNDGLCFYFSPYEIAPYASGVITAVIPYSSLSGILNDAYFPAERDVAVGSVEAQLFDSAVLEEFTQLAEVVLTDSGEKILLSTDGCLYNIRLETGTRSADGEHFVPDQTVFAASSLTPGDGIMVEASFEGKLPTLRLTYTTQAEIVSVFISINDGKVTLN